jgi:hypothetical protein
MYLVGVHAQVSQAAPPLLDRTLNALVESLVEEALRCFKQVKRFGMGGMLRVSAIKPSFFLGSAATDRLHVMWCGMVWLDRG